MSVETAPHSPTPEEMDPFEMDITSNEAPAEDTRELSPAASSVRSTAERIASFLETRQMNKAHREALREDRAWTKDRKAEQDDAYASYAENLAYEDTQTEAIAMNEKFDRKTARKEAREQAFAAAKERVRGFGRSILRGVEFGRDITVGSSLLLAEAGKDKVADGIIKAKSAGETVALKGMYAVDSATALTRSAGETVALKGLNAMDSAKESFDNLTEKAKARSEAAKIRRTARRARWAESRQATAEKARARYERAKTPYHIGRAAAGAAIQAARSTAEAHKEQNKV